MAEYHYKYTDGKPASGGYRYTGGSGANKNNNSDFMSWVWIVLAMIFIRPLGFFLLVCKLISLADSSKGKKRQGGSSYHYTYTAPTVQTPQQTASQQAQAAPQQSKSKQAEPQQAASAPGKTVYIPQPVKVQPRPAKEKTPHPGRGFVISGSIVTGVFGLTFLIQLAEFVSGLLQGYLWSYMFSAITTLACFTGVGVALLHVGLSKRRKFRRFKKYQALIGKRERVSISALASATGKSYKKVCDDLQDMLDMGVLPMGYLDLFNDQLVLTDQGIDDAPAEEEQETILDDEDGDDAILAEIRAVNDDIPDPVMSAKIDRIQEITSKILDYQRKNPDKAGQLRSFLNYYLPTTLKILRAYAQLDQQGVEGENISAAKERIEGMMDKVVEGFEKQLDKLFENAAMDITSDVAVLEKMLDNDGLSSGGLTLGG